MQAMWSPQALPHCPQFSGSLSTSVEPAVHSRSLEGPQPTMKSETRSKRRMRSRNVHPRPDASSAKRLRSEDDGARLRRVDRPLERVDDGNRVENVIAGVPDRDPELDDLATYDVAAR